MLNVKKIIALNIIAFTALVCIAKWQSLASVRLYKETCKQSSSTFPKADDFSIVNILSLKFR